LSPAQAPLACRLRLTKRLPRRLRLHDLAVIGLKRSIQRREAKTALIKAGLEM